jgi:catechol 2,3-dioxygenase-like lactoylglutathione lyase family enzyme
MVLVGVDEVGGAEVLRLSKVPHISFAATDAEASADFWRRVFGFADLDRAEGEGWRAIVLVHRQTSTVIELLQREASDGDGRDPTGAGFDHLGLRVDERRELDSWKGRFERLDVPHTAPVERSYGAVLAFQVPDGIQLELIFPEPPA